MTTLDWIAVVLITWLALIGLFLWWWVRLHR